MNLTPTVVVVAATAPSLHSPRAATYVRGNLVLQLTMTNIVAAPAPASRKRANDEEWGASLFVELPPAAWFSGHSEATPAVVLVLPPWTGSQPLSGRERAWIREPIVRSVPYIGWSDPRQLAVRAQLREGILVTRAGRQPPPNTSSGEYFTKRRHRHV
ncbi:uncharacterized protein BO95DRAFT_460323 [Aspergillus brunneoviolaceus CBS 621.78]|uniref:Uncharacterized protein n=1 Tax=Aspergillus brunneoviolaceus CBS 621.78 TaxID=1450534 RepID=A0ACD1GJL6_9EURO|nr:hypothetical protein BO95DRAFT_460323 [Aspergillus brunneoviolaceus CBS 621.78]RAH49294.1 hypothetical protein BO95DRAFT_460323 [Aspergillus brunneoviolaceus CBS 621.78]